MWMADLFLQLNQDKSQRENPSPRLRDLKPSQCVKNLGVIFGSELTFSPHIKNIAEIGCYLLNMVKTRGMLMLLSQVVSITVMPRSVVFLKRASIIDSYCRIQPLTC